LNKKHGVQVAGIVLFVLFIIISLSIGYKPGLEIYTNFISLLTKMIKILPCAFILIGLFEVWIKKQTVQNNFSGIRGYFFAILLSSSTMGGLYVAFPVAYSLCKKGVKMEFVFTYLFASAVFRIPMTIYEASFLGLKFTSIRLLATLPLIILASIFMGKYLDKNPHFGIQISRENRQ